MARKGIKRISILLVAFATLVLILEVIHIKMVAATEKGLWDPLPGIFRRAILVTYPVALITSYLLFIFNIKVKTKFDAAANVLFLLNGLILIILLAIFLMELLKNL